MSTRVPWPAKVAAQTVAVHGVGRATARRRVLPNTLIAGGQRCGTTSMYRALSQHPAALKPVLHKGVHYFDTNYDHSLGWYRSHFPLEGTYRRAQRSTGAVPVTFESSPYYGFHPLAAARIDKDLPGVKLLILIRDPVERAYSAHAHELARGFETEPFEVALDLEESRLAGEDEKLRQDPSYQSASHQHNAYVARGQYIDLLRRLESVFGRDRLHIVDSGSFFTDPSPTFARVLSFLGLPDWPAIRFERHNARPRAPMSPALRRRLDQHFEPFDEELIAWLGWTPHWRQ